MRWKSSGKALQSLKMPKPLIKNHVKETFLFYQRAWVALAIILILSSALIARFIYLQIIENNLYTTLSKNNRVNILPIPPKRGLIYDRNGVLLASNTPIFSLDITPSETQHLNSTIESLKKIMPISETEIQTFYQQHKIHRQFEAIPLKLKLTDEEMAKFYVNQHQFPGTHIHARLIREYPMKEATANVVGYVSRITKQDLKKIQPENYVATHYIGKTSIERFFEPLLHGITGYQQVETNANGEILRVLKQTPPIAGDDLYLTIDSRLQKIAHDALKGNEGAVVAIAPKTGQVLVMVSNPSYDPNLFVKGMTNLLFQKMAHDTRKPLFNRAIRGQFPPASTLKPLVALTALDNEFITPQTTIIDKGWFRLPKSEHQYWDWRHDGHGKVNLFKAIVVSCDTYFYQLAVKLGIARIADIMDRFGFGRYTGIEMREELPGLVPLPQWKKAHHGEPWYIGDTIITIIGQGYALVTPLQLAVATATLANQGLRFKPTLLLKKQSPSGNMIYNPRQAQDPIMLHHESVWKIVIDAMQGVITQGTGARHFGKDAPYSVAAKTGTAQLYKIRNRYISQADLPKKLRDHSWFIAFAPVKNPKIAIAVIVEHDDSAPTVARKVMDKYMEIQ